MHSDELVKRVHANTLKYYRMPVGAVIQKFDPLALLNSRRLDVMARVLYARDYLDGVREGWGHFAYENLIRTWTNDFQPPREVEPGRFAMEDYHSQFTALIDSVARFGVTENMTVIPTCRGTMVDGAHRLAASIALGVGTVPTVELDGEPQVQNYATLLGIGMDAEVVENLVLELIRLKPDSRIALLFPCSSGAHAAAIEMLEREFLIDYRTNMFITYAGMERLMDLCYGSHGWWDSHHARQFARRRFNGRRQMMVVCFQETADRPVRPVKDKLRKSMGKGNHGIHTTDMHGDTLAVAEVLLSANGRTWMNFSRRLATPRFDELFSEFRLSVLEASGERDVCVDSGGVLAVHGLRDVNDLDYLQIGSGTFDRGGEINCHNAEYSGTRFTESEIIRDPRKHLTYRGIRFAALDVVTTLKLVRNTRKDLEDVGRMRSLRANLMLNLYLKASALRPVLCDQVRQAKKGFFIFSISAAKAVLPKSLHPVARKFYFWWAGRS